MQKLAKREEQIMQAVWKLGKALVKDIITELPDPKPHYNTIATMVRILEDKGFLTHDAVGNTFIYYALVSQEAYQRDAVKDMVKKYFDSSYTGMLAYFAKEENLTRGELEEIINLIEPKK
jgi:BlaI family transcriptional regulator, penicillinase repressor